LGTHKAAKFLKNNIETKLKGCVGLKNVHALTLHTLQRKKKTFMVIHSHFEFHELQSSFYQANSDCKQFQKMIYPFWKLCIIFSIANPNAVTNQ